MSQFANFVIRNEHIIMGAIMPPVYLFVTDRVFEKPIFRSADIRWWVVVIGSYLNLTDMTTMRPINAFVVIAGIGSYAYKKLNHKWPRQLD